MVYEKEINVLTNKQGVKGDSGVGISSITNYYLATNSTSITTSTTGWTTTIQTVSETKKYLWNYEKITYTDNTEKSTTPVIIGNYSANGTDGADGKDGTDGIGIKSIAEKYAVSTSNTTAPTTWKDTPPQMTATNKYLWNYEIITYSNDATEETAKRVIGVYGDKGATGEQGLRGSLEFSGTEINAISDITEATYTITTASTGITSATMPILVGDTYINVTTQDVWICSTSGTPTTAKWKYQGRRCSDKDDSNRFRMFTPATDNGTMQNSLTKSVVKGENPFGKIDDLLKITNTNAPSSSEYIPYYRRTKIDPKKTYRHVTYIKQEDANCTDYIGIAIWEVENSFCLSLSGSPIYAAYFTSASNFGTLGRWYMVVGYIVANGTTTAPADSGVYDIETKQKVRDVNNFQWKPNVTYCNNSGCLIRYTAGPSATTGTAYLYDVRLDEVNGTEPTLNELLNLDTTTKSKGTWAASTIYNTGDIVYINGNSYICTANHTSGTSFSTTNWNLVASKGADGKDGADGKNAITMTSATTPNGEYNGQIGIWQGQVYQWNGTSWMLTSGMLPTDPVLHYSFDELPNLPDGTSILALKNGKTYDIINNWEINGTILKENINGNIRITSQDYNSGVYFRASSATANDVVKIKIKTISGLIRVIGIEGYNLSFNYESGEYVFPFDDSHKVFLCYANEGAVFEIEELYIGDTSYTTPVIDNSGNNKNSTDVKGLVTKGVSGKCFRTLQNGYVVAKSPLNWNTQYEYSVSTWIKRYNVSVIVANNWDRCSVSTFFLVLHNYSETQGLSRVDVYTKEDKVNRYTAQLELPPKGEWFHYVAVVKDGTAAVYINGKHRNFKIEYETTNFNKNTPNLLQIGKFYGETGYLTFDSEFDDFQIFDRALSEQEVLGLYLARGNTPKQYTMADYYFDNSSGKYYGYEKPAVPFLHDTYLNTTTGYLYEYDGVKWVAITDVSDSRYNQAVNDMVAFAENNPTLPFLTARNAWIERLAVDGLLANKIATQKLILRENGAIKSSNYVEGESGFLINSNGTAEFYTGRFRGGLGTVLKLSETDIVELKFHGIKRISIFREIITSSNNSPISNELGRPVGELLLTERIDYKSGTTEIYSRTTTAAGRLYDYVEISMGTDGNWKFPILEFDPPQLSSLSYVYWGCIEQIGPEEVQ